MIKKELAACEHKKRYYKRLIFGKMLHTFSPGEHSIAVKVVDDEGLKSMKTIKWIVNGVVKKT